MLTMIWVSALVYVLRKKNAFDKLPAPLKTAIYRIPFLRRRLVATDNIQ